MEGVQVNWTDDGENSVTPADSLTDANGKASAGYVSADGDSGTTVTITGTVDGTEIADTATIECTGY